MRVTAHVSGAAPVELAWERYAEPARWATWAPQIRSVDVGADRIAPGVTGTVHALFGISVPFEITEVDEANRTWSWTVHPRPVTMRLEHTVEPWGDGGSRTGIVVHGPLPVVLSYAPLARIALHRLVAAEP